MTQEYKELLLKDLSARLPYSTLCYCKWAKDAPNGTSGCIQEVSTYLLDELMIIDNLNYKCQICEIKPYLRPMSSMTEEEIIELKTLCSIYIPTDSPTIGFEEYGIIVFTHHLTNNTYSFKLSVDVIDWLLKNHFDFRGLIPKNLAIEVTKENNPYEN